MEHVGLVFLAGLGNHKGWELWDWIHGAASNEDIPSNAVIPGKTQSICVTDFVGPDFGTSRVNTDTSVSWDYSVGHGHLHKIQGFGSRH